MNYLEHSTQAELRYQALVWLRSSYEGPRVLTNKNIRATLQTPKIHGYGQYHRGKDTAQHGATFEEAAEVFFDPFYPYGDTTLTLADERPFHLTTNTWQTKLEVLDGEERPLLHYTTTGWLKHGAALSVAPEALALPEQPWLATFGWYVVVMMQRDSVVTTTIAATS